MAMVSVLEKSLKAVAKPWSILFFFLNNFLDFEQVVVMINLCLTAFAKTELGACRAFISDTNNRLHKTAFAFSAFMDQSLWLNFLCLMIQDLFLKARNESLHSLIDQLGNCLVEV